MTTPPHPDGPDGLHAGDEAPFSVEDAAALAADLAARLDAAAPAVLTDTAALRALVDQAAAALARRDASPSAALAAFLWEDVLRALAAAWPPPDHTDAVDHPVPLDTHTAATVHHWAASLTTRRGRRVTIRAIGQELFSELVQNPALRESIQARITPHPEQPPAP